MKMNCFKIAAVTACVGVLISSCGSSNKLTGTAEQKAALGAGNVKKERDECQNTALERGVKAWRAWGTGTSANESFATNLAELDARTKIARQLTTQINGLIRNFNQQHSTDDAMSEVGKAGELQEGYVDKLLSNTKVVCSNAYVTPAGKTQVYVCIEMSDEAVTNIVKQVSNDKKLAIDFAEHQFVEEMQKAKEDFRSQQTR